MKEIRDRIVQKHIHISRVSNDTFLLFNKLAKDDFCDDYGNCLKFLLDNYIGLINTGLDEIHYRLDMIEKELQEKKEIKEEKPVVKRTLGGKIIK